MKFTEQCGFFFRSFFLQTGWNYLKYQNLGLFFVMWPFLKKLYGQNEDQLPSVVARYLSTFNTQPVLASFCFGALAKQEEIIAHTQNLTDYNEEISAWNALKRGITITTASIGDRLFWGTLKPLTLILALFVWLILGVHIFELSAQAPTPLSYALAGSVIAFAAFNVVALFIKWAGIKIGYDCDERACFGLTQFDWNRTIYNAKKMGLIFTVGLLLWGIYYYLRDYQAALDVHFVTRAVLILFFVCISFLTHQLRIANVYLYLAAAVIFNIACYL